MKKKPDFHDKIAWIQQFNMNNKNNKVKLSQKRQSKKKFKNLNITKFRIDDETLQQSFKQIINIGFRSNIVNKYLRTQFTEHAIDDIEATKRNVHQKQYMVDKVEEVNEKFFVPQLQIDRKSIFKENLSQKCKTSANVSLLMENYAGEEMEKDVYGNCRTMQVGRSLDVQNMRNQRGKMTTIFSKENSYSKKGSERIKFRDYFDSKTGNSSEKKNNTFLFHLPTKKPTRKVETKEIISYAWQDTLHEILNYIMDASIRSKLNIKVDRDRISSFLKKSFLNEVITTYYKFEQLQNFKTIFGMVEDLTKLPRKQANLIAFFTYDFNGDNFICQEDLYHFLEKLPLNTKIMRDVNLIVEFLRKNKVRSQQINLPKKIIFNKHKNMVNSLWKNESRSTQNDASKKKPVNDLERANSKFFSLQEGQEDVIQDKKRQTTTGKKFQINFDVFNLIFAQRSPVLIDEIIKKFTRIPQSNLANHKKQEISRAKTEASDQFLCTRSKGWKRKMSMSENLRKDAKKDTRRLSYKV